MKIKVALIALFVTIVALVGCSKGWQTLNGEGFTVEMPGQATKQEQTAQSPVGPITIHMYMLDQKSEGYIVGYTEYPPQVFEARDPEQMLDGARDGAISNVRGRVTNERKVEINGAPGREITGVSDDKNAGFTARVYLDKPRMYMLVYTQAGKDNSISDDGKRFLDSFKLTK